MLKVTHWQSVLKILCLILFVTISYTLPTSRGRYAIKAFPTFLQLHGKTFDYKLPFSSITRLFLLPHNDQRQMFFVIGLDPPIRQGQTRYYFVIFLLPIDEDCDVSLTLTE